MSTQNLEMCKERITFVRLAAARLFSFIFQLPLEESRKQNNLSTFLLSVRLNNSLFLYILFLQHSLLFATTFSFHLQKQFLKNQIFPRMLRARPSWLQVLLLQNYLLQWQGLQSRAMLELERQSGKIFHVILCYSHGQSPKMESNREAYKDLPD